MHKQAWLARSVRWVYELLLSVYYVLMFMWTGSFLNFAGRVGRLLNHGVASSDYSFKLQYLSWFLLAGIIFTVLRILSQVRPLKTFLCQLVGAIVFLVPLVGMMPVWAAEPGWSRWLWVEGAVAAGAVLLYANWRRPAPAILMVSTALLHFGLWAFVYFGNVRLAGVLESVAEFVLLPLLGSLAWGLYFWLLPRPNPTA
jgi:hypothetical protein